jgi:hypothetical protein
LNWEEIMFCDACGAPLQPNQAFCGKCAKEVRPGFSVAYPRPDRVREHVRLLGILWLAYSAFHIVGGIVLSVLARTIFSPNGHFGQPNVPFFIHSLFAFLGMLLLVKSFLGILAGWGLLQRESWGRVLTLILAFIALLNPPFGTGLGIYTLWVLLPAESEKQYMQQVAEWRAA